MDYFEMERRRYSKQGGRGRGTLGVSGLISPVIKKLIIINLAVFLVQAVLKFFGVNLSSLFGFVPYDFIRKLRVWQIVSYMFLHGGLFHVFWNLLALWMFGKDVEENMGSKNFLKFYLVAGVFAGLCSLMFQFNSHIPIIGASGAIFAVITAFGMLFPEREITLLIFFIIPVKAKAKYIAMGFAVLTLLQCLWSSGGNIAYFAHLGGILFAYIYFRNIFNIGRFVNAFPKDIRIFEKKDYDNIPKEVYISEEVDPILEKISKHGIHSLSGKEKKILDKAKDKL